MSRIKEPTISYEVTDDCTFQITEYGREDKNILRSYFDDPNFTQIPNQLLGSYEKTNSDGDDNFIPGIMSDMSEVELKVCLALCRLTYGFQGRSSAYGSVRFLERMTGLSRQGVLNGIEQLTKRGLFKRVIKPGHTQIWHRITEQTHDIGGQQNRPEVVNVVDHSGQRCRPYKESIKKENKVPAPKAAREQTPLDEPEYVDCDEDGFPVKEKERPKWQTPDTEEQKEFLAVCGAKWFEPKQKRKVKALLVAFRAGDIAGDNVYLKCLEYLEGRTELVDVPPCIPRDWYEFKKPQAIEHRWNRWGFVEALLNRDALVEHCRLKQRELDRNPSKRYTLIEDEPIDEEPAVGGTLDMQAIRREFIEKQRKKGVVVNL